MFNMRMPAIERLHRTNLDHDYHHSMLISVLRGLAAVEVAAAHLRAQFYPGLKAVTDPGLFYQAFAFFTGFAHQAVLVFFLLSGWLVGGALLNKYREKHSLVSYGIDRITRLWIVLIPAFGLSLLLGAVTGTVDPTRASFSTANEFSATTFIGNLSPLGQAHRRAAPRTVAHSRESCSSCPGRFRETKTCSNGFGWAKPGKREHFLAWRLRCAPCRAN